MYICADICFQHPESSRLFIQNKLKFFVEFFCVIVHVRHFSLSPIPWLVNYCLVHNRFRTQISINLYQILYHKTEV